MLALMLEEVEDARLELSEVEPAKPSVGEPEGVETEERES